MFALTLASERQIAAPAAAVWALLSDPGTWMAWNTGITAVHRADPAARFDYTLRVAGVPVRFDVTVDTWNPPQVLAWSATKWWGVAATRTFTLTPVEGGVRVQDTKRFSSPWIPLAAVYPRPPIVRMSERWLADLARAAEATRPER